MSEKQPPSEEKTPAQELIELSSKSGKLAHPVFDSRGIVRWPKKMSYEEVKKFVAKREEKKEKAPDGNKTP